MTKIERGLGLQLFHMVKKLKTNIFWLLFREKRKKNFLLLFLMFGFNTFAAILEGISFAVILVGLTFLSNDGSAKPFFPPFLLSFTKEIDPTLSFIYFMWMAIFLQIFRSLVSFLGQMMVSNLALNLQKKAQEKIYAGIFHFSYDQVSSFKIGDLINHTSTPPIFFPLVMDSFNRLVISSLMMVGYSFLMLKVSLSLTFAIGSFFIFISLIQKGIIKKIKKSSETQAHHMVELSKETTQYFNGFKLVHVFTRQKEVLKKIENLLSKISKSTFKLSLWNHLILPVNETTGIFMVAVTLMLGFVFLKPASAPLATLLTFVLLIYRFGGRLQNLMLSLSTIASQMGSISRMAKMIYADEKESESHTSKSLAFSESILFDSVTFSYPNQESAAVSRLSFTISKGKTLAFVGKSGSGKSTVMDLLVRLYEPQEGQILLDGKAAQNVDVISWRKLFGVVSQECFLFHDSIEENIRFGNLAATMGKIQESAELAGAHEFIKKLPQGYKTVIGERGYRLSGGERQRISLARALIRDPEILVLDEATSNLDSQSEQDVQAAIETLRLTKTIVVVAHRLSTIASADEIIVLENGKIVERGTHEELIHFNGTYQGLWKHQIICLAKSFT